MGIFDNYECEGQMDIFDWLQQDNPELKVQAKHPAGEWVKEHGPRVMFNDIQENKYYIADYSTCSNKFFKVVYVMEKTEDTLHYVDEEKGIKGGWKWGNSYSALTRKQWVDAEPNNDADEAYSHGWWYELEEKSQEIEKKEPKKESYKRKPVIYHMGLSAYYYECPYCKATNSVEHSLEGAYCRCCSKYFDGEVERKSKDLKECEEQLGPGGGAVYKDEKGKWRYSESLMGEHINEKS